MKLQADDEMYDGQKTYDKGHLLPSAIYSFDEDYMESTFTYTNAVPQVGTFNKGVWQTYERKIREFAETCGIKGGNFYAITGVAQVRPYDGSNAKKKKYLKNEIRIPEAMWTAGCCITSSGVQNVAVVGNNRGSKTSKSSVTDLTVEELQNVILEDVNAQSGGIATSFQLFPGNPECENIGNHVVLSRKRGADSEAGPSGSKKPRTTESSHSTIY